MKIRHVITFLPAPGAVPESVTLDRERLVPLTKKGCLKILQRDHASPVLLGIAVEYPAGSNRTGNKPGRKPSGKIRLANLPKIRHWHHGLLKAQAKAARVSIADQIEILIETYYPPEL